MESFSVQWRSSTRKDIRSLPRQEVARIVAAVAQLASDPLPHGTQKLSGSERTYTESASEITALFMRYSPPRTSSRSNTSDTARTSIGNDRAVDNAVLTPSFPLVPKALR